MAIKGKHTLALYAALRGGKQSDLDKAAVELAKDYARKLDAPGEVECQHCGGRIEVEGPALGEIGPKYLAALTALGMTPAGRSVKGGGSVKSGGSKIDELRERRAQRSG